MKRFRDFSIGLKLTFLTAITTTLALVICCAMFVQQDIRVLRRSKVSQLTETAEILSQNGLDALAAQDVGSAQALLDSLSHRKTILSAWMLDENQQVVAKFSRQAFPSERPLANSNQHYLFDQDGTLYVWSRIALRDRTLGWIVIHDSLQDMRESIRTAILITLSVLLACVIIGVGIALPLNRHILKPIVELTTAAQHVSAAADFSLRVDHESSDEIGILYREFNTMLTRIQQRDALIRNAHHELQDINDQLEERVVERTRLLSEANEHLTREMKQSKIAAETLRRTQDELIEVSRKAGMSDVANSVLHNVGNVLNSLNVSASIITQRVHEIRIENLKRCVGMVTQHQHDLPRFLTSDQQGQVLVQYLPNLVDQITCDQQQVLRELESLTKNVEHIKDIVRAQQSLAGAVGVIAQCDPMELMEDAIRFADDNMQREGIDLFKNYHDVGSIWVEKSRLLQILVNLIKNAKEAMMTQCSGGKAITLAIHPGGVNQIEFVVTDTGQGIAGAQLTRIFSDRTTTKTNGHGFGLHASANFAREMGGELLAESDGVGCGATFRLRIPRKQPARSMATTEANFVSIAPAANYS